MCVFCYLKQEETKEVSKVLPKIGNLIDAPDNLMKLTLLKKPLDDVVEANNNERSETDTNPTSIDKPKQSTSFNKPLDESVTENVTNKTSLKELTKYDITNKNNVPEENIFEQLPGDKSRLDTKNDSQKKSEETSSLNKMSNVSIKNNETQLISSKETKKEDMVTSNNESLNNNTVPPPEEKSEKMTTNDL